MAHSYFPHSSIYFLWAVVSILIGFAIANANAPSSTSTSNTGGQVSTRSQTIKPAFIDIEWVVQEREVTFTGFFFEFLGYSSALTVYLPLMKYSKSNFVESFDEPLNVKNPDYIFQNLFDKEKNDLIRLSSNQIDHRISFYDASLPKYMFMKQSGDVTQSQSASFCSNTSIYHNDTRIQKGHFPLSKGDYDIDPMITQSQVFVGGSATVGENIELSSPLPLTDHIQCCEKCCELSPVCSTFSYSKSSNKCNLYGAMKKLSRANMEDSIVGDLVEGGFQKIYSPPKVVIFHGQSCIYRNDSIMAGPKRDPNTIYIARFMVERAGLIGGMNLFDYSIMSCASNMDEIWVPTDEHKRFFEQLAMSAGYPIPSIYVIPETVDTTLFDPVKVSSLNPHNTVDSNNDHISNGNAFMRKSKRFSFLTCGSKMSYQSFYVVNNCSNVRLSTHEVDLQGNSLMDSPTIDTSLSDISETKNLLIKNSRSNDNNDNENIFEFLSIFKWESRKGWNILLESYWSAFTREDPIVLRIVTYIPKYRYDVLDKTATILDMMRKLAKDKFNKDNLEDLANVIIEDIKAKPPLSRSDFRDIYARADAFVLPTKGEGWGLPVAEAMAMELPVVVTNCLGPSHYATGDNAYLIPIIPGIVDDLGYVEPNGTALIDILRRVVSDSTSETGCAAKRGKNARVAMEYLSATFAVESMVTRLSHLYKRRGWEI